MAKVLRVIDPFFDMNVGDTFTLTEDGKFYVFEKNEEFHTANVGSDSDMTSSYKSCFKISQKWAKQLIEDGYLEEVDTKDNKFVNVFDEIDKLLNEYNTELKNIPDTMKETPECLKVERTTVLSNIIKVLSYLKTLRK